MNTPLPSSLSVLPARPRRGARPALLLTVLLLLAALLPTTSRATAVEIDYIVAVVNEDVITWSELESRLGQVRQQITQRGGQLPDMDRLRRQVLERMIQEQLQLQMAKIAGIRVDDETVTRVLENIAGENGMTLSQFRAMVERDGTPFATLRENVRKEITIARLRKRRVEERITVTDSEVKNQLAKMGARPTEYHLAHILIATPEAPSPDALARTRARALEVLERVRGGADFAQTALAVSDGQDALAGGDMGWRKLGQLPTAFTDIVAKMQPGEISDLIQTTNGWHIVKLLEVRNNRQPKIVQQTLARHILIRPNALLSDDAARQKLAQLRERILAGEDFALLARTFSDDKASAVDGGSLGWTMPGSLVAAFQKQMDTLRPGEISEPFKTRFGWHIVQVMSRRQKDISAELARREAREQIRKRKTEEAITNWLRRLRDEAYVEVRLDQ
ncbi:MAG TPA: molecular chaperone SurA [Gammaproteobacteria bacterium]|nr:molecular chaperone SurA [Gammaproteobacteria bacterium]